LQIASFVHIGHNAVVGQRVVLNECCYIDDDAVLQDDIVVPLFAHMKGNPGIVQQQLFVFNIIYLFSAKMVGKVPLCTQELMKTCCESFYEMFRRDTQKATDPVWS
jgi:hypothetical protein